MNNNKKHGMYKSRLYSIWRGMKTRCSNNKQPNYNRYGANGVTYDEKWEIFDNFRKDMGASYKEGLTLERIDNSKGYSKDNCRWVAPAEQNRNMRTNINVIYNGVELCLTDLAKALNVPRRRLYTLHNKGYKGEQLIKYVLKEKQSCIN